MALILFRTFELLAMYYLFIYIQNIYWPNIFLFWYKHCPYFCCYVCLVDSPSATARTRPKRRASLRCASPLRRTDTSSYAPANRRGTSRTATGRTSKWFSRTWSSQWRMCLNPKEKSNVVLFSYACSILFFFLYTKCQNVCFINK